MKRILFLSVAVALIGGFVTACHHHCDNYGMAVAGYSVPLKTHGHHSSSNCR